MDPTFDWEEDNKQTIPLSVSKIFDKRDVNKAWIESYRAVHRMRERYIAASESILELPL